MASSLFVLVIFLISIAITVFLILKKPYLTIKSELGEFHIETYFLGVVLGAISIIIFNIIDHEPLLESIKGNGSMSPLGILVLFLSMVFMSIFLDQCGVFEYCAKLSIRNAHHDGRKLFISLYVIVSLLTLFTSNDIVILTFTPFIYYFAKHAKINPKPYLIAEFFAANTWTIMFHISNTTNIVVATAFDIRFFEYFKWMFLPAVAAGLANFFTVYLLFRKDIEQKIKKDEKIVPEDAIKDKTGAVFGLILLAASIILLLVAPYIGVEIWVVAFCSGMILLAFVVFRCLFYLFKKRKSAESHLGTVLETTIARMPWSVVPFVLSLFILVGALKDYGISGIISDFFNRIAMNNVFLYTFIYGISSTISANILNNIPMTVAFVPILSGIADSGKNLLASSLAVVIGSNLGANLTPVGALAGIMWMQILNHKNFRITFGEFVKYGSIVTGVSLFAALLVLGLEFVLF
jgi:arsenical pump membrane protein